jgi:hypothetical protein
LRRTTTQPVVESISCYINKHLANIQSALELRIGQAFFDISKANDLGHQQTSRRCVSAINAQSFFYSAGVPSVYLQIISGFSWHKSSSDEPAPIFSAAFSI